jgi:transposase InsO family protein
MFFASEGGRPGDRIGGLPVIFAPQPGSRPITHLSLEVLRRPVESGNYTSLRFRQRLEDHGVLASMGSVSDSYDNALMENFFSTLKTELVYRNSWRAKEEAENTQFCLHRRLVQPRTHPSPARVALTG